MLGELAHIGNQTLYAQAQIVQLADLSEQSALRRRAAGRRVSDSSLDTDATDDGCIHSSLLQLLLLLFACCLLPVLVACLPA